MNTKVIKVKLLSGLLMLSLAACNENKEQPVEPRVGQNENRVEINTDNDNEWDSFRTDAESRIDENEKKIRDIEDRLSEMKKDSREEYNKRLSDLKEFNAKLRARVKEGKKDGGDKWEEFKREFNQDMDELGKAMNDFTKDNKK